MEAHPSPGQPPRFSLPTASSGPGTPNPRCTKWTKAKLLALVGETDRQTNRYMSVLILGAEELRRTANRVRDRTGHCRPSLTHPPSCSHPTFLPSHTLSRKGSLGVGPWSPHCGPLRRGQGLKALNQQLPAPAPASPGPVPAGGADLLLAGRPFLLRQRPLLDRGCSCRLLGRQHAVTRPREGPLFPSSAPGSHLNPFGHASLWG